MGGIKEKLLAAKRAGVLEILLPAENEPNVHEDLSPELLEGVMLHYVSEIREVFDLALQKEPMPPRSGKPGVEISLTQPVGPPN